MGLRCLLIALFIEHGAVVHPDDINVDMYEEIRLPRMRLFICLCPDGDGHMMGIGDMHGKWGEKN